MSRRAALHMASERIAVKLACVDWLLAKMQAHQVALDRLQAELTVTKAQLFRLDPSSDRAALHAQLQDHYATMARIVREQSLLIELEQQLDDDE